MWSRGILSTSFYVWFRRQHGQSLYFFRPHRLNMHGQQIPRPFGGFCGFSLGIREPLEKSFSNHLCGGFQIGLTPTGAQEMLGRRSPAEMPDPQSSPTETAEDPAGKPHALTSW
jgi:hypothetical protein